MSQQSQLITPVVLPPAEQASQSQQEAQPIVSLAKAQPLTQSQEQPASSNETGSRPAVPDAADSLASKPALPEPVASWQSGSLSSPYLSLEAQMSGYITALAASDAEMFVAAPEMTSPLSAPSSCTVDCVDSESAGPLEAGSYLSLIPEISEGEAVPQASASVEEQDGESSSRQQSGVEEFEMRDAR